MNYYTIYDDVACECGNVFPAKNDAIALRSIQSLFVSDKVLPSIVEHLKLYCVGSLNIETMEFVPDKREIVMNEEVSKEDEVL